MITTSAMFGLFAVLTTTAGLWLGGNQMMK